MDRIEVYRRGLQAEIAWGIGSIGCHDVEVCDEEGPQPSNESHQDEDYYVITADKDGTLSVAQSVSE